MAKIPVAPEHVGEVQVNRTTNAFLAEAEIEKVVDQAREEGEARAGQDKGISLGEMVDSYWTARLEGSSHDEASNVVRNLAAETSVIADKIGQELSWGPKKLVKAILAFAIPPIAVGTLVFNVGNKWDLTSIYTTTSYYVVGPLLVVAVLGIIFYFIEGLLARFGQIVVPIASGVLVAMLWGGVALKQERESQLLARRLLESKVDALALSSVVRRGLHGQFAKVEWSGWQNVSLQADVTTPDRMVFTATADDVPGQVVRADVGPDGGGVYSENKRTGKKQMLTTLKLGKITSASKEGFTLKDFAGNAYVINAARASAIPQGSVLAVAFAPNTNEAKFIEVIGTSSLDTKGPVKQSTNPQDSASK